MGFRLQIQERIPFMKEIVRVKIREDKDTYDIQYGSGAQWERMKKSDLPWSVAALINAYVSGEYEPLIEIEQIST